MFLVFLMLTLTSLNVNGARDRDRRQQALQVCNTDIICIQETHWDDECMREVERDWIGEVYVSNGGATSKGVAILVKRGRVEKVKMCANGGDGRVVGITFEHMGEEYKLLNIYAPNEDRERGEFFKKIGGLCGENCIVVGDFNVWCGRLDVAVGMVFRSDKTRAILREIMRGNDLVDVWRERNPKGRVFTRRKVFKGVLKQSRIDLVLSTKGIAGMIGIIEYKDTAISDHKVVGFSVGQRVERRGGGVWCMNGALLNDEKYKRKIKECIERLKEECEYEENMGRWWENLKGEIKRISIGYSLSLIHI